MSEQTSDGGRDSSNGSAYDLWRQWYAMEDRKPAGTVGDPDYDAWTAECAVLYVAAKAADHRSPFVRRALAGSLPVKVL